MIDHIADGQEHGKFRASVRGFDHYHTKTGNVESGGANRIALWMLDRDDDGRGLAPHNRSLQHPAPRDRWERLARSRKREIDCHLIEACCGAVTLSIEGVQHGRAAVKVVDDWSIDSLKSVELT